MRFNETLSHIQPPPFEKQSLIRSGRLARGALHRAVRILAGTPGSPWAVNGTSLADYFGTATPSHCFRVPPWDWLNCNEVQITLGLAHFLHHSSPIIRNQRIWAFQFAALNAQPPFAPEQMTSATAEGEVRTKTGKRIDLLITAAAGTQERTIVVEAKLYHFLSSHQPKEYERSVTQDLQLNPANCAFLVVAPMLTERDHAILRKHQNWRFLSWSRLLTRMESVLSALPAADDEDFRRFRHTVWVSCR